MLKITRIVAGVFVLVFILNVTNLIAVTSTYFGEYIEEESSNRGYYPISLYRDSSACGWMCNGGSSEYPADYIFEFSVPKSYANRSRLRITSTNSTADCYIRGGVSARVYSDNTIRICVGYNWVFFCGLFPYLNDVAIWIK